MLKNKKVTVVVPVYADWESLSQCITSLKENLDKRHRVLLVNDCGPEVEQMEQRILRAIRGLKNFSYERNPENLGFVKTCNRAALELDQTNNDILLLNSDTIVTAGFLEEMLEVLYLIDRHGAVSPRSSNATIATIPFKLVDKAPRDDLTYTKQVHDKVKDHLPRYTVAPVAPGFCMLIRRSLIRNFGLFDEVYGRGYNEENDFCMRINRYGYSCVLSNHALVYHLESRSFGKVSRSELETKNARILIGRYPYYPLMVKRYLEQRIHPVDQFADAIANIEGKTKILIDLYHFPTAFNGSTKNGMSLLKYLSSWVKKQKNVEIVILTNPQAEQFHNLGSFGFRIVYPGKLDEIFHIAYCPTQLFHVENMLLLNRYCLRIVFSMLDIISLRCNYLLSTNISQHHIFLDSLKLADKVITISDFTAHDLLTYFNQFAPEFKDKLVTIHQGMPGETFASRESSVSARTQALIDANPNYIFVFGNDYTHKAIRKTVKVISKTPHRYIILGPKHIASKKNVQIIPSGALSDKDMVALLKNASLILFPSQYEGFGFPIIEAAFYGKNIVYFGSEVGDEIVTLADGHITAFRFSQFDELAETIDKALQAKKPTGKRQNIRTLDDYNAAVVNLLMEQAAQPFTNFEALQKRWYYFAALDEYYYSVSAKQNLRVVAKERLVKLLKKNPTLYSYARSTYRKLRGTN